MVRAWYLRDDSGWGRNDTGMTDPPRFVQAGQVCMDSGVQLRQVDVTKIEKNEMLQEIEKELNLSSQDILEIDANVPKEKFDKFFEEHLHTFPEVRLVLEGSGYFDVRDLEDCWIRMEVTKGDLIIVPAGLYHRFTVTDKCYIKAKRYFKDESGWIAFNRSDSQSDTLPARVQYVEKMNNHTS